MLREELLKAVSEHQFKSEDVCCNVDPNEVAFFGAQWMAGRMIEEIDHSLIAGSPMGMALVKAIKRMAKELEG